VSTSSAHPGEGTLTGAPTTTLGDAPCWDDESRELSITCDAQGRVHELDARARRLLGAEPGSDLVALSVSGTESKTRKLLERGAHAPVADWEVAMISRGRPATISFCARPASNGGVHLHGLVMPENYGSTVAQLTEALNEVVDLNRVIARQKKELTQKNEELTRAYQHLDESNRGVLTLHAELEDNANTLRRAADVKTRVVTNVSHEFRTPLHTILGLSKLLLGGTDGPLNPEQEKQLRFIRGSAEELSTLVNDMLDLSKAESGTALLRPEKFRAEDLVIGLRGQLRPLVSPAAGGKSGVELIFDPPPPDLAFDTDRPKLSQILRNLVSNALKFTEQGEVRVKTSASGTTAIFQVVDTGIGIAPEEHERIFEEFGQVDGPLQAKVKGTGIGLALSRKLAELLGGTLEVESEPGKGATFTLRIPVAHPEVREYRAIERRPLDPNKAPVLVLEDDRKTIFIYEKYLAMAGFQVVPARTIEDARQILTTLRPAAIVLDVMLEGESSWTFLSELKREERTRDIPVLVVTVTNKEQKARALGADEFWLKPVDQDQLLRKLRSVSAPTQPARVLVIDDDDRARYLMAKYLEKTPYHLMQAATGPDGVRCAREKKPDVILLDFLLEDMTAFDVLDDLKADPRTRGIPVVIVTSHVLDARQQRRLAAEAEAILSKESLSREIAIQRIRDALQQARTTRSPARLEPLEDA